MIIKQLLLAKHFNLYQNGSRPDDRGSLYLKPEDLALIAEQLGSVNYGRKSREKGIVKFRCSLYFVKNLKAGDVITEDAIGSKRPILRLATRF